jgi:hypothetical protein
MAQIENASEADSVSQIQPIANSTVQEAATNSTPFDISSMNKNGFTDLGSFYWRIAQAQKLSTAFNTHINISDLVKDIDNKTLKEEADHYSASFEEGGISARYRPARTLDEKVKAESESDCSFSSMSVSKCMTA